MKIPESMKAELAAWNDGKGIDLASWIGCEGTFSLAIGYTTIFWPDFFEFNGYIFRDGFSKDAVRGFEAQHPNDPRAVEAVVNHLHLASIQHTECEDITKDKILVLGNVLKEVYEAKLKYQFPDRPCIVVFYKPNDPDDLIEYQITFWQKKHENDNA